MSKMRTETECFWCAQTRGDLDEDHIFPRSIGGTKELSVPSCRACQTSISKAELELSRKSAYAMHLVEAGPRGRHRRTDPASGLIEAAHVLVPHPLGGYNETALKAGSGESPSALPYIEINVADESLACRRRASEPAEIDKLVTAFEEMLARRPNQNGMICELSVLTHDLGEIGKDPDFWPRIVLDLRGRLFIRARTPDEAVKFVSAFVRYLRTGALRDHSRWITGPPILGSTPHQVSIVHDEYQVGRVFAKIACSFAFIALGDTAKTLPLFNVLRKYALGSPTDSWAQLVREIRFPGALKQLQDRHVAALARRNEDVIVLVSLFGSLQMIDLGEAPESTKTIRCAAATARVDGTKTKVLPDEEAEEMTQLLFAEIEADMPHPE
jgi:hypothetical protein